VDVDAETHRHMTTGRRENKFGIEPEALGDLLRWLGRNRALRLTCLHMHLGSQITSTGPYEAGIKRLLEAREAVEAEGFKISWINAGGGFGIAQDEGRVPAADEYARAMEPLLEGLDVGFILELGRYLVGRAGCLVTGIVDVKRRNDRTLYITDAGMTEIMRPALYEAFHRIIPVAEMADTEVSPCDVAGPICESTDVLGWQRPLPALKAGDLLGVMEAGAYAMSMSSNYNTRLRAAEVFLTGEGRYRLVRRREVLDDILAAELDIPGRENLK
jgi:diaminopimelate decarboxylase